MTVGRRIGQQVPHGHTTLAGVPDHRADQLPHGCLEGSGTGRAGMRSAREDHRQPRALVLPGAAS